MSSAPPRHTGETSLGRSTAWSAGGPPSESSAAPASEVFPFLLELGTSLLSTRDAVSNVEERLLEAARAYGQRDVHVIVLPTAVAIARGAREPVTMATTEEASSQELRLDQITEVLGVARLAAKGGLSPAEGRRRLAQVRAMPNRYRLRVRVLGYAVATLGIGLVMDPAAELLPWYLALGALVAVMQAGAARVPGLPSVLPVLAAATVSAIAFAVYAQAPLQALIPPLIAFLPGSLMTAGTVDLASEEIVTGSSRFTAGLLQLALLAVGIIAGARLVGVTPATASRPPPTLSAHGHPGSACSCSGSGSRSSTRPRSARCRGCCSCSMWPGQVSSWERRCSVPASAASWAGCWSRRSRS